MFSSFLKHHLHKKECAVYILLIFITLCFHHQKNIFFSYQTIKTVSSPDLTLFTCTSCFQLPASTCRTLSSCIEIGSCFKTTTKVTWAWGRRLLQLGARILYQFSFLLVVPLKFLVPHSWPGFWSLVFFHS